MRQISNVGWCWSPRCELCIVCTGRRVLQAQLTGVGDEACSVCSKWTAQLIPMEQVTDEVGQECLWKGQLAFCSGRIEFGLGAHPVVGGLVLLEGSVYEIAIDEGPGETPPIASGDEVLIGDWRADSVGPLVDCDFNVTLGGFVKSSYTINQDYQHCNWENSSITITKSPCVDVEV